MQAACPKLRIAHARTHARTHACTHARTHARTRMEVDAGLLAYVHTFQSTPHFFCCIFSSYRRYTVPRTPATPQSVRAADINRPDFSPCTLLASRLIAAAISVGFVSSRRIGSANNHGTQRRQADEKKKREREAELPLSALLSAIYSTDYGLRSTASAVLTGNLLLFCLRGLINFFIRQKRCCYCCCCCCCCCCCRRLSCVLHFGAAQDL